MARLSYIVRRGATYYARMRVPLDLVKLVGANEHSRSLRTKDENEAKKLMWPIVEAWGRLHDDLRARRELTPDDKADAVWQHYEGALDRFEEAKRHLPTEADIEAAKLAITAKAERGELTSTDPLAILDVTSDVLTMQASRSLGENPFAHPASKARAHKSHEPERHNRRTEQETPDGWRRRRDFAHR